MWIEFLWRFGLLSGIFLYYWQCTGWTGAAGRYLVRRGFIGRGLPLRDAEAGPRLIAAGLGQAALFLTLSQIVGSQDWTLVAQPINLIGAGLLGIGEMAIGSYLSLLFIRIATALDVSPESASQWISLGRGGWMQLYAGAFRAYSPFMAVGGALLYVVMEECVFRGIVVGLLLPFGDVAAICISTGLFILVQRLHMPSWRAALFPAAGALVVGAIHAGLLILTKDLLSVVVAHVSFFVSAMPALVAGRRAPVRKQWS